MDGAPDKEASIRAWMDRFAAVGAPGPRVWVSADDHANFEVMTVWLLVREAWKVIVSRDDLRWIDADVEGSAERPHQRSSAAGRALQRILDAGVDRGDIATLVQDKQVELLGSLLYRLSYGSPDDDTEPDAHWALAHVDRDGQLVGWLNALHEYTLAPEPAERAAYERRATCLELAELIGPMMTPFVDEFAQSVDLRVVHRAFVYQESLIWEFTGDVAGLRRAVTLAARPLTLDPHGPLTVDCRFEASSRERYQRGSIPVGTVTHAEHLANLLSQGEAQRGLSAAYRTVCALTPDQLSGQYKVARPF